MKANVFTIAAGTAFADVLAQGVLSKCDATSNPLALAGTTILLPTRRAVRTLSEAFARRLGGAAILPQIRPLGDVDEDDFSFDASTYDLFLPPAIAPVRRRLLLAALIERWDRARNAGGSSFSHAQSVSLGRALADFIDEAETHSVDLTKFDNLADSALAEHWQHVKSFLALVREEWPRLLAAEGAVDPAKRRNLALSELAARCRSRPPQAPVIAAGTTGSIPATAALLREIAWLPNCAVVLPGLDRVMDEESWTKLDEGHPQFGLKHLIAEIGIDRPDVADWPQAGSTCRRGVLLRETLRPAPTTDAWCAIAESGRSEISDGLEGLSLVEAAHPAEEAVVIALILRHVLEQPAMTGALVTPDRDLARRVASELRRWSIVIDDSAGQPLLRTAPGAFLSLLAQAAADAFSPLGLLALLKHPLAAGGQTQARFRRRVRDLEKWILRGLRPDPGLEGIAAAIAAAAGQAKGTPREPQIASLRDWFQRLALLLEPLEAATKHASLPLSELLRVHVQTAEKLAATDEERGAARLWAGAAGEPAAALVASLSEADSGLPAIDAAAYPALFRMFAEEQVVRPAYGSHPRLAILGPLEARLQSFDVVVLGGLNEGTWPRAAGADPWLSRPMRKALGLELPERRIGLAAHDFAMLAASPRVFLTRTLKSEGAPTVASRWIERLKQLTRGLGLEDKLSCAVPYAAYAHSLDIPETPTPEGRPEPRPLVHLRPRGLSVTEIETWLRDPYAVYAKHVLRLRPLDPLDPEIGPLERGSAIHLVLQRFFQSHPEEFPADALSRLIAMAGDVFKEMAIPAATLSLWRPRFARAAKWFVERERERRSGIEKSFPEIAGTLKFDAPGGLFTLRGRADRVDVLLSGGAAILDYKTGSPPSHKQVEALLAPQLPLEGAILAAGGFAETGSLSPRELIYIRLSGGATAGEWQPIKSNVGELVRKAEQYLKTRVALFDDENEPYPPRIAPLRSDFVGDYDHLARVREWSLSGWKEEDE
jgi:ATP-dependent helicase/nuclease subunit B